MSFCDLCLFTYHHDAGSCVSHQSLICTHAALIPFAKQPARRNARTRHSDSRRQSSSNGNENVSGAESRTYIPYRFLWVPSKQVSD
ncbi:hypothetical protein ERIC2_c02730 [Paenibacillus larvae subsp. larvae DSM 25430]|uniref:Uncharacterized protein n=1 Tax=Paenibacillus larvae subsp. larvae DSM 25430 TaxID=697284 RepID=V9W201_9BACL|nr:hypothetical protein ERIC2_c02730 [Paenibacillus larvae subsp. larvae DSM 25430]